MHLTFFTNAGNLKAMGHLRLTRFFQDFTQELKAANISLPDHNPANDDYFADLAPLIASPAFPEPILRALSLLEFLAAPQNVARLDAEIARQLPCVSFDRTRPVQDRALELWCWSHEAAADLAGAIRADPIALSNATEPPPAAPQPSEALLGDEVGHLPSRLPSVPSIHDAPPNGSIQNEKINNSLSAIFTRWTDPNILTRIGLYDLDRLFGVFAKDLAAQNIPAPASGPFVSDCSGAYARIFSAPELLPKPLLEALLAIQEFASPNNKYLLEKLAADSNLDDAREPEGWAIRLWLRAPFDLQYIKTLQAHIPDSFYDNDIEYCDQDESLPASTLSSPLSNVALETSTSKVPGQEPLVEISPCPRNRIARLPKETRDSINNMLGQGLTYGEILRQLGDTARGLNKSSLSRWKRGPYQSWLKHQERLEESGSQLKFALSAVRQNQNNQIHEATQQIAALRISELFSQLDLSTLKAAVLDDPATLARLASLLPKLSQGGLECERQRRELSSPQPAAAAQKTKGPIQRGLSRKALRYLEHKLHLM